MGVHRQLGRDRDEGGREDGHLLPPGLVQVEDPDEACHEGWQEGGLRQGSDGEGKARAEDREGLPGCCPEEERLSKVPVVLTWSLLWLPCSSKPGLRRFSWAVCGGGTQGRVACATLVDGIVGTDMRCQCMCEGPAK